MSLYEVNQTCRCGGFVTRNDAPQEYREFALFKSTGAAIGVAALLLASCASKPGGMRIAQADPLEKFNRTMYGINKGADTVIIRPATQVYRAVTPAAAKRGLTNVFNNVDEPFSAINSLLQGKPGEFFHTMGRFLINTILGVGGLADHATDMGLEERPEDLGQTFAVWGIGSGPYVVLPFFGPSTLRDSAGIAGEFLGADPYRQFKGSIGLTTTQSYALTGIEVIDKRSYLIDTTDSLMATSLDEYATIRSAYLQFRQNQIYDGAPPEDDDIAAPAEPVPTAEGPNPEVQPVPASIGTKKPAETAPTEPPLPAQDAPADPNSTPKPTDQERY